MILHELRIEGFGRLSGEIRFVPNRVNFVVGPNEAGKSTLAAAVAAALYGLDEDRRGYRGRFTPREQYQPWDGRPFALELVFEVDGKRYTVNRHFERGTVSVFAEGRGDVSEDFRTGPGVYSIGEMLLGLNLDQFVRSAFWLQPGPGRLSGGDLRPDASLASMLERQATTGTGDASAQAAIDVLEGALRHYPLSETRLTIGNFVKRLSDRAEKRRSELAAEEERLERAALALEQLQEVRRRREALETDRKRAAAHVAVLALAESQSLLDRDADARVQLTERRREREELARVPRLDPEAAERLRRSRFERDDTERWLKELTRRRESEWAEPHKALTAELESNRAFAWASPVNSGEVGEIKRARERLLELRGRVQAKLDALHEELKSAGIAVDRLEELQTRFAELAIRDANLLTQYPASAQASATAREAAEQETGAAEAAIKTIEKDRWGQRWSGGLLVFVGLAAAGASVALAVQGDSLPSFVILGLTVAALGTGGVLLFRAAMHRAPERKEHLRHLTTARRRLQEVREQGAERELALSDLAKRLGYTAGEPLLHDYADYQRLVRETERLSWVRQELEHLDEEERSQRRRGWELARRAGLAATTAEPPTDWDMDDALVALQRGIETRIRLRGREESLAEMRRRFDDEEQAVRRRLEASLESARTIVRELGMPDGDWEKALAELEARRLARERLETIDKLLPDLERQMLGEAELKAAREECERLRGEVELVRASHPDFLELPGDVTTRAEATRRRAAAEHSLEESAAELLRLERSVGHLEKQGAGRAGELRLELAEVEREKRRAEEFQTAVQLAIETWRRVARETHAVWSDFLTFRVNELLPALGPAYKGFQVTDDLEYSLLVEGQRLGREKLDQVLSAGTRDQLALAIRLAVCEFLARGGKPVPIILDDPFASADDERAEAGLRFLANGVAPRHQVIVLTCHRERLASTWARQPEWFGETVHRIGMPLDTAAIEGGAIRESARSAAKS
jgi:energy-coupling factor transporter ATP-binding protein EcfA2